VENMELPKVKKIIATIPLELFEKLESERILSNDFDNWLSEAILERLQKEGKVDD
jgi:hypothetical protein